MNNNDEPIFLDVTEEELAETDFEGTEDLVEDLEEVVSDIEDNGLPGDSDVVDYSIDLT